MSNLTEQAIRRNLHADQELRTLSHDSKFLVAELADDALVLLLGATKNRTRVAWTDLDLGHLCRPSAGFEKLGSGAFEPGRLVSLICPTPRTPSADEASSADFQYRLVLQVCPLTPCPESGAPIDDEAVTVCG